ncbi:MAG TPA: hypothetical protein VHL80_06730 [Polyangia bacterium]|nr:hypothetical protein [Polyangia bacterium]
MNPWLWTSASGATDADKAIEDIGPYEAMPNMAGAVNTNAHYWTTNVGIAWDRDVDFDFDGEPVDLDGDGKPDAKVTRHVHAKGGVLANPALFGLTPTVADPRGHVGQISVSTGVLGLREALRPNGQRSGEIGMTCWLCHGAGDPGTGAPVLGLPGARFDYGLLLATAAVLDDKNEDLAAYRAARGFPPARTVRARLLLAGPGRQDLTGEFGLDVTVPFHSARYAGTRRVRQGTKGLVNPISVPGILAAPGLALENWSGSENADAPWLARLVTLVRRPEVDVLEAFGLGASDRAASRRALMFDLRNLGTLGLQQDSFPGLLFADALASRPGAELSPEEAIAIPAMYATVAVRRALADGEPVTRPTVDLARVARGRAIFLERVVGEIANRQILQTAPRAVAAARLEGPLLAPIDPTKPMSAKLAVRCADCHNASPLERALPLAENPPPLGRCSHCHLSHPELPGVGTAAAGPEVSPDGGASDVRLVGLATLPVPAGAAAEVAYCARCHARHRAFGPVVYSNSRLFPFDADGDGDAQLHPEADARAGGIGTDPWLAFDVPRPEWPFSLELPVVGADPAAPTKITRARSGVSWVRTAPLLAVSATAPYLHNGSVPTLRALLEPPSRRPARFPLGATGFVFDTRLPGNHNTGHDFGTKLKPSEKDDLVAFLQTL